MDDHEKMIAHRKWALEFLAKLNPGKQFDGDVFADADALVAYVVNGRANSAGIKQDSRPLESMATQHNMAVPYGDPLLDVNTGLAQ